MEPDAQTAREEMKADESDMHADQALESGVLAIVKDPATSFEEKETKIKALFAAHVAVHVGEEAEEEEEAEVETPADRQEQLISTERMEQTGLLAEPQIDEEHGILRHVHIAGMVSKNDGARYAIEAHRKAAPRFEQMPVGLDHDYSGSPLRVGQAWGVLSNITVEADGPYGDLAYLKSHERTEQVLEDARRKTGIFSLSMVCQSKGRGKDIDEYIPSRVDLVVRGATTRTLFNQQTVTPPAVTQDEFRALTVRLEQETAARAELEKRLTVFEQLDPRGTQIQATIAQVEAKVGEKTMKAFWDTTIPAAK